MIVMVRLDERLIHGQVAIKWSRHTGVDRIVVVSDEAAANPLIQKSLMMAAPATAKTAIKSIADALTLLKDPRIENHKVLVIVASPEDLLTIVQNISGIGLVNVGNYGRIAPRQGELMRKSYRSNLYAYDNEVEVLKKVIATGIKCNYQTIPDDTPDDLEKVLNK